MPFIAAIVLFWQRRRLIPLLRRAWASIRSSAPREAAATGSFGRLADIAKRVLVDGWRALDTDANAGRLARFVARMRSMADGGDPVRADAEPRTAA